MDTEANRRLACRLFERLSENDVAGALDLMAEEATWWIAGKPGGGTLAGSQSKARMAKVLAGMSGKTVDGLNMTVKATTAEGERVALEMACHARLPNGRIYEQEYHTLVVVRDGRIAEVREYMDTQHLKAIWVDP